MHYFCQNLPIFKGSFASSIKKLSIEHAPASEIDFGRAFSGSSMLRCNTNNNLLQTVSWAVCARVWSNILPQYLDAIVAANAAGVEILAIAAVFPPGIWKGLQIRGGTSCQISVSSQNEPRFLCVPVTKRAVADLVIKFLHYDHDQVKFGSFNLFRLQMRGPVSVEKSHLVSMSLLESWFVQKVY